MVGLNLFGEIDEMYYQKMKAKLRKSILSNRPQIRFEDIAGNEYAKEVIKQTFIFPEKFPNLFRS